MGERPYPADILYRSLFEGGDTKGTLEKISSGLEVILKNVEGLVKDANILKNSGSVMTASFLGATAREEMGKVHILIDACRLDISRHKSVLMCLCKAFYDHITKYAYYDLLSLPRLSNMEDIKDIWAANVKKWWPSEPESGEPDLPHATNYLREMPLYVDYIDWDKCWYNPQQKKGNLHTSARLFTLDQAEDELKKFRITYNIGLYKTESLSILNKIYRKSYVTEKTDISAINSLFYKTAIEIDKRLLIPKDAFSNSFIKKWPLYHFTTVKF